MSSARITSTAKIKFKYPIKRHFELDINVLLDYGEDDHYSTTPISKLYGLAVTDHNQEEDLELKIDDVIQITDDTGEYWSGANQRTQLVGHFPASTIRTIRTRLGYDSR